MYSLKNVFHISQIISFIHVKSGQMFNLPVIFSPLSNPDKCQHESQADYLIMRLSELSSRETRFHRTLLCLPHRL